MNLLNKLILIIRLSHEIYNKIYSIRLQNVNTKKKLFTFKIVLQLDKKIQIIL